MRSFYFAVELRRARFDIAMPNALVFDMPVQQSLEFMTTIRSDLLYTEWELVDEIIDKMNRIFLGVACINLQGPDPCRILNRGILIAFELLAVFSVE
jgi:hypothetical protein